MLPDGALAFLYGMKGSLKTFVALDLAERIALGWPWRGHEVKQAPVVFVAAEDAEGLLLRHRAWLEAYELEDNPLLDIVRAPVNLMNPAAVSDLAGYVLEEQKKLVVIDTLHRSMGGGQGSEMSDTDTAAVVAACDQLQRAYYTTQGDVAFDESRTRVEDVRQGQMEDDGPVPDDADDVETLDRPHREETWRYYRYRYPLVQGRPTVVLNHHPNQRTNTLRGHGGFYGAADTILRMTRHKDGTSVMWCEKQKNWEDGWSLKFALRKVGQSAVVVEAELASPNDDMILRALEEQDGQTWGELVETSGVARGSVNRSLGRLVRAEDLRKDADDRYWLA